MEIEPGQSVYIVDAQDSVVAHRDPAVVLSGTHFNVPKQDGRQPGLDGSTTILAVETVRFGAQDFNIVVEQVWADALTQAINSMYVIGTNIAVALIVASILGYLIVHQIVGPIQAMAAVARAISTGDLSQQVEITHQDELGVLARAFNSMTVQLGELINSLEQRIQDRTERLEIVATLGEKLNAILDPNKLLSEVTDQTKENLGYYHAQIYLLDDTQKNLVLASGTGQAGKTMVNSGHSIPFNSETSLVARAARSGETVIVNDVQAAEDWLPNSLLLETRAEIAVPIVHKSQIIGVLDVQEATVAGVDETDASLLRSVANQVAVALANAQLFAETTRAKEEAEQAREEAEETNQELGRQIWQNRRSSPTER